MTLNDDHIRSLIASDGLIRGHEPRNVQNCGCMLTAGTVFSPDTGREVPLGSGSTETQHFWELPPSETLTARGESRGFGLAAARPNP